MDQYSLQSSDTKQKRMNGRKVTLTAIRHRKQLLRIMSLARPAKCPRRRHVQLERGVAAGIAGYVACASGAGGGGAGEVLQKEDGGAVSLGAAGIKVG